MTSQDISSVAQQLEGTSVDGTDVLSFKGKGFKLNTEADAKEIIDGIERCTRMITLCMEGNTLGVAAAEAIARALKKHPEFQRAKWSDMFTGRLKTEIPGALKHLGAAMMSAGCKLMELDLSDNAFGPNGVEGIVDLLKSKCCYSLKELRLNNNGLGTTGGKMLAGALLECYKSSKAAGTPLALKVFISGRGRLENDGSIALSEVFKLMGSLEEVAMPQNGINHEGITALADAFSHNPNLRILNLNDNTFTVKGAKSMAQALPKLQNLEIINFGDCLVRTDGAKHIAKAIKGSHAKLRELIFSGNEIGKAGGAALVDSVENKEALETIDMDSNSFGEEGVELLTASMETMGKSEILGSLSGDEGSEDEEDGEYDESCEDEGIADDIEGEHVDDPALQVQGKALSPKQQNVKDLLSFPSPTKLHGFGKNLSGSVRKELGNDVDDPEKVVHTLIRLSLGVTDDDTKAKVAVCDCADNILEELLENDIDNMAMRVANAYLVYMGILKGEDKKYSPPSDITGPLIILEHVVRQKYFPRQAKKIMSAFMDKPHPLLNKSTDIRSKLLQTLYAS